MKIYIRRAWNAGLTLSEAFKYLHQRYGFNDKRELIAEWQDIKRRVGCATLPVSYVEGWKSSGLHSKPSASELAALVSPPGMFGNGTYGDWLGVTGPGALLREIINNQQQKEI